MECNRSFLLKSEKGEKPDNTEFMELALQLYDVYWESILGFPSKKSLAGERIVLVYATLVSM